MDQTVDPPSSLETVATDDVNLDESEEDDSFTRGRLRPWYRFGKFDKPRLEAAYRVWHHRLWMPRVKVMYLLSSVVYLGGFMFNFLVTKSSLKSLVAEVFPHTSTTLSVTAFIARSIPLLMAVVMILPATRKLITPDNFQLVMGLSYVVPIVIEQVYPSIPVALNPGQLSDVPDAEDAAAGFFSYNASTPNLEMWHANPTISVRQTYYHVTLVDFYFVALGALSGLLPEIVLLVGSLASVVNQLQFSNIYGILDTLRPGGSLELSWRTLRVTWLYRFVPLLWSVIISIQLDRGQRMEFYVRVELKRAQDRRIEQLKREKSRLDWDRRLAQNASLSPPPVVGLDGRSFAASSTLASCEELVATLPQLEPQQRPEQQQRPQRPQPADARSVTGSQDSVASSGLSCLNPRVAASALAPEVRHTADLNWEETRQLSSLRSLRLPRSSKASSSTASNATELELSALGGSSHGGSSRSRHMCKSRESALWRTLKASGLISPTPSSQPSARGSPPPPEPAPTADAPV